MEGVEERRKERNEMKTKTIRMLPALTECQAPHMHPDVNIRLNHFRETSDHEDKGKKSPKKKKNQQTQSNKI